MKLDYTTVEEKKACAAYKSNSTNALSTTRGSTTLVHATCQFHEHTYSLYHHYIPWRVLLPKQTCSTWPFTHGVMHIHILILYNPRYKYANVKQKNLNRWFLCSLLFSSSHRGSHRGVLSAGDTKRDILSLHMEAFWCTGLKIQWLQPLDVY